jgi:hypothetical protein
VLVQSATPELWSEWRDAVRAENLDPVQGAIELFSGGMSHGAPGAAMATRVYAAARVSRLTEAASVELAIKTAILPGSTNPTTDHAEVIARLGIETKEAEASHAIATGLAG